MSVRDFELRVVDALARIETEQKLHNEWAHEEKERVDGIVDDIVALKLDVASAKKKTAAIAAAITTAGAGLVALFRS